MSRVVAWFSCGVASAVATKLAIAQYGKVVIARCIVREEHPDNDRFAADCERWFGLPITNLINKEMDGSIYNVFDKTSYISGIAGAPCTRMLKREVREVFQKEGDIHVMGYGAEEQHRFGPFLKANAIDAVAPLIERGLTHDDCLAMVKRAGIELPILYKLGYKHNNCIGCCKATGAGYWNKIRDDFPMQFERMSDISEKMGVRMTKIGNERIFLKDLPKNTGDYPTEHEAQCGIFCALAEQEYV